MHGGRTQLQTKGGVGITSSAFRARDKTVRPSMRMPRRASVELLDSMCDNRLSMVLRRSLRSDHKQLERRLCLPGSVTDAADYGRLLAMWTVVWTAVAAAADPATAPGSEVVLLAGRARAALASDRSVLGHDSPAPAVPLAVPTDEASLWGVAYVMRGSSLGNRVLHPLIVQRLGGAQRSAFRYLGGGGADVRSEWSDFCRRLDHWGVDAPEADRASSADAAATTFRFVGSVADAAGWVTVRTPPAGERPS